MTEDITVTRTCLGPVPTRPRRCWWGASTPDSGQTRGSLCQTETWALVTFHRCPLVDCWKYNIIILFNAIVLFQRKKKQNKTTYAWGGGDYFTILEKEEEQWYQETNVWDVTLRALHSCSGPRATETAQVRASCRRGFLLVMFNVSLSHWHKLQINPTTMTYIWMCYKKQNIGMNSIFQSACFM